MTAKSVLLHLQGLCLGARAPTYPPLATPMCNDICNEFYFYYSDTYYSYDYVI